MKKIFFDVETTGLDEEDRICQIALNDGENEIYEYIKPPLPIKLPAMATHHITEDDVKDAPAFADSKSKEFIEKHKDNAIFIAHNAQFDLGMLEKEGIEIDKHICTYKVASYLDKEVKLENYQQQYLRYYLGIDIDATAHDAKGDVDVLMKIFNKLKERMSIERMVKISSQPLVIRQFPFGKHKGEKIEDVAKKDIGYLNWLYREKMKSDEDEEAWIHTLEQYI